MDDKNQDIKQEVKDGTNTLQNKDVLCKDVEDEDMKLESYENFQGSELKDIGESSAIHRDELMSKLRKRKIQKPSPQNASKSSEFADLDKNKHEGAKNVSPCQICYSFFFWAVVVNFHNFVHRDETL